MNYGYLRVSTKDQDVKSQKLAIQKEYKISKWVQEKKSGTVDFKKED